MSNQLPLVRCITILALIVVTSGCRTRTQQQRLLDNAEFQPPSLVSMQKLKDAQAAWGGIPDDPSADRRLPPVDYGTYAYDSANEPLAEEADLHDAVVKQSVNSLQNAKIHEWQKALRKNVASEPSKNKWKIWK